MINQSEIRINLMDQHSTFNISSESGSAPLLFVFLSSFAAEN